MVLNYTFDSIELPSNCAINYTYLVDIGMNDFIGYLFEKKYNRSYDDLGWWLEDGAKEYIKELEFAYMHNTLDTYKYIRDPEFISWLTDKYYDDALEELLMSVEAY